MPEPSDDGLTIARQRIAQEREQQTGFLDLCALGLDGLPDELFELTHLERLHLGRKLRYMRGTWQLDLHERGTRNVVHAADLERVARMPALTALSVQDLALSDLTPLIGDAPLSWLDVAGTEVSDLSPLKQVHGLRHLDCGGTQVSDLSPLAHVTALQHLVCSHTRVSDLSPLSHVAGLQRLDCGGTHVSDLKPLARVTGLQHLDCSITPVSDLEPLAHLERLKDLNCMYTSVSDLKPLAYVAGLQHLNCSQTQVSDLWPLVDLPWLKRLAANACSLRELPEALVRRPALEHLSLYRTEVPGVPPELRSQKPLENCLDALRAHFDDLAHGAEEQADVKLLVLGNGGAGKTQLIRRLCGEAFQADWDSTHGIRVTATELPEADDTRLNIWDFGGQDIYHGTHALFVRSRAICLLVWGADTENTDTYLRDGIRFRNHPLRYWVDYVRHVVGGRSPTLLVQTKCDHGNDRQRPPIAEDALAGIAHEGTCAVSAATDRGMRAFRGTLADAVDRVRELQELTRLPAGWLRVQRRIEALRNADGTLPPDWRFMHRETFDAWCAEEAGVSSPDVLLTYLHNAGIVFHDPKLFDGRIVLDHAWALNPIYAVFDRNECYHVIERSGGRFTQALLAGLLWNKAGYSEAEQRHFLGLMQACGICFIHRDPDADAPYGEATEYIAPDLLPPRERVATALADRWGEAAGDAEARYTYPFLHPGLIRGLVAEIGDDARQDALYWHGGVYVYERTTRSRAMIEQQQAPGAWDGTLRVQTKGAQADTLLAHLKKIVEEENRRLGLAAEVADHPASGGASVPATRARRDDAPTDQQLAFGGEPISDYAYCVSYAWRDGHEDQSVVDRIDEICSQANARGEHVLRDIDHLPHGASVTDFMKKIGSGPRVFVFLSKNYLYSPNTMYELYYIWLNSGFDVDEFRRRIRVFLVDDTDITDDGLQAELYRKWNRFVQQRREEKTDIPLLDRSQEEIDKDRALEDMARNVKRILHAIGNTARPRSWQAFIDHGFGDPPDGR